MVYIGQHRRCSFNIYGYVFTILLPSYHHSVKGSFIICILYVYIDIWSCLCLVGILYTLLLVTSCSMVQNNSPPAGCEVPLSAALPPVLSHHFFVNCTSGSAPSTVSRFPCISTDSINLSYLLFRHVNTTPQDLIVTNVKLVSMVTPDKEIRMIVDRALALCQKTSNLFFKCFYSNNLKSKPKCWGILKASPANSRNYIFLLDHLIPTFVLHVQFRMKGICLQEWGLRPGHCEPLSQETGMGYLCKFFGELS